MKKSISIVMIILNMILITVLVLASAFLLTFSKMKDGMFGYAAFILSSVERDSNVQRNDFFVIKQDQIPAQGDLIAFKDHLSTQSGEYAVKYVVSVDDKLITAQNSDDETPVVIATVDENYIGKVVFSNQKIAEAILNLTDASNRTFTYVCIVGMAALLIIILVILFLIMPKKIYDEDDDYYEDEFEEAPAPYVEEDEDMTVYKPKSAISEPTPIPQAAEQAEALKAIEDTPPPVERSPDVTQRVEHMASFLKSVEAWKKDDVTPKSVVSEPKAAVPQHVEPQRVEPKQQVEPKLEAPQPKQEPTPQTKPTEISPRAQAIIDDILANLDK